MPFKAFWDSAGPVVVTCGRCSHCVLSLLCLFCRAGTWLPKCRSWMSSLNLMPPQRNGRTVHTPTFLVEFPSMSMDTQVTLSNSTSIFLHNIPDLSLFSSQCHRLCKNRRLMQMFSKNVPEEYLCFVIFILFKKILKYTSATKPYCNALMSF